MFSDLSHYRKKPFLLEIKRLSHSLLHHSGHLQDVALRKKPCDALLHNDDSVLETVQIQGLRGALCRRQIKTFLQHHLRRLRTQRNVPK